MITTVNMVVTVIITMTITVILNITTTATTIPIIMAISASPVLGTFLSTICQGSRHTQEASIIIPI